MATFTGSPCAACKFLRRKCTADCVFAPYFPPEDPHKFANVHKIFGASNVSKILNDLPLRAREDAVNSLAYEADARVKDPVYGCVGAISILQSKVAQLQAELVAARSELCRLKGLISDAPLHYNKPVGGHHFSGGGGGATPTTPFSHAVCIPSFGHAQGPSSASQPSSSASQPSFASPLAFSNPAPATLHATLPDCAAGAGRADQYACNLDDALTAAIAIPSQSFLPFHPHHHDSTSSSKSKANVGS